MTMKRPETPLATTDIIIEMGGGGIVLVRRKHPPLGWALPGGFIDPGEQAAAAARREAKEETALDVTLEHLLGVYSDPKRDPRGLSTMSVVFVGHAAPGSAPRGGDDAAEARVFPLDALPPDVAFDHATMIADYRRWRATGEPPPLGR